MWHVILWCVSCLAKTSVNEDTLAETWTQTRRRRQMHCSNSRFLLVIMLVTSQLSIIVVFSRTGHKTESGLCNLVTIVAFSFR